jgi:diguanylate cyclase (GGDEF)-like protein
VSHISDFLQGNALFKDMSGLELNAVSAFLEARRLAKDEVVFREGDPGDSMYIVKAGLIGSYVTLEDGSRREIYEHSPGNLFGEMAIIEGAPRSATCFAKADSELLILEALDFYRLVWEHPVIGVKLLSSMAGVMVSWLNQASGFLGDLVRWGEAARYRAIMDDLSGLFNRRFLEETVRLRFARGGPSASAAHRSSLLMLDIDRFREINALYGPQAGDAVITNVAAAFQGLLGETEVAARLSGDEFAVFLPGAGPERAAELAESLRATAEKLVLEFRPGPGKARQRAAITMSVGFASCPEHASTAESLFTVADRALYGAKESGRNRVASA